MFHNIAMDVLYPSEKKGESKSMKNMSPEELKKIREELKSTYGEIS